jgi:hypothetical protein
MGKEWKRRGRKSNWEWIVDGEGGSVKRIRMEIRE